MKSTILAALALLTIISCKENTKKVDAPSTVEEVKKEVEDKGISSLQFQMEAKSDSDVAGNVIFTQAGGTVSMVAKLTGLTEGEHAIHIHEKADCSSADGKSTGGHWNPTFKPHGKWGADGGYHKGDIGNFTADAEGNATIEFSTSEWCMGCGDEKKDIMGKAIIVHQGVDDFTSQPSGAAGARVACTGIIR